MIAGDAEYGETHAHDSPTAIPAPARRQGAHPVAAHQRRPPTPPTNAAHQRRPSPPATTAGPPPPPIRHDPHVRHTPRAAGTAAAALATTLALSACGLNVMSADLFLLRRTGQPPPLTVLVNDDGVIRCNNGPAKNMPNQLLLQARDLADSLNKDAQAGLKLPAPPNSAYSYSIKLQNGTISFPDTAAATRPELAQAEQFALQAAHGPCAGS
jgi:hypothetical protein